MRRRFAHGLASVLVVVSLGAAQGPTSSGSKQAQTKIPKQEGTAAKPPSKPHKPYQVGTASWYGEYFEGKATASGEPYNMYDLTAAHPTLPLGSWVKVTNLRNGRVVHVRINDRGPIIQGRIIDLSYGAASALRFKNQGLQRIRLDLVEPEQLAELRPLAY
jgi:rare lipoprotein A